MIILGIAGLVLFVIGETVSWYALHRRMRRLEQALGVASTLLFNHEKVIASILSEKGIAPTWGKN